MSILNQTYKDFELIVVDDCSTDSTREVIENYSKMDDRVKYIRNNKNLRPSGARNAGIKLSIGEFIAFQDDDDEWYPYKLEKQVNLLNMLPEDFGVVYSGYYKLTKKEKIYIPENYIFPKEGNIHNSLLKGNFVGTPSILARKSALLDVGFFDEKLPMLEDWELVIRLSKKYLFKLIDEPLYISYDTPNSVNKQSGIVYFSTLEFIIKKHINDFLNTPYYKLNLTLRKTDFSIRNYKDLKEEEKHSMDGIFYLRNGFVDKAKESFKLALEKNPFNVAAIFCLGAFALKEENYTEAIDKFNFLIKNNLITHYVNLACVYNNLGIALIKTDKKEEGYELIKKAHNLNNYYRDAIENLEKINNNQDDFKITRKLIV
jgi:glycosyltransferase involved in cell wall biosynthesis